MLTLFLFQRELLQLKKDYTLSPDNALKAQLLNDIALLSAAIKEVKEAWEAGGSLDNTKNG